MRHPAKALRHLNASSLQDLYLKEAAAAFIPLGDYELNSLCVGEGTRVGRGNGGVGAGRRQLACQGACISAASATQGP